MTIQTVRPDSTSLSTAGVTGVGGAVTNHGALNDASDATGITATLDNAYTVLGLANPTALAANQRVRAWRIRMRVARTAADLGHTQRVEVKLRDAANRLSAADTISYSSTTVKEFTGPWRPNGPGNAAFNNTILNAMRMDVVWRPRVSGAVEWLEARGAFVDFDYNDRPVVSAVTMTGVTTTSFPDIGFTYSDTENDPQVRVRFKVFPQTETVKAGFDPETWGTFAYDSGEIAGNQTSITITKSLTNGVTYVPYVKAAQKWDGPEGPVWWSAWVAGSAAAISLTPPGAYTAAVAVISTLPDYRALHTITAGTVGGGTSTDLEMQVLEKCARFRGNFYNWAHPQIQSCGGLTIGVDGFYTRLAAFLSSLPLHTAAPSGPLSDVGARMISWNPSVGAFSGLDIGLDNNASTDEQPPYLWPAVVGLPMRLSVWACTRSGTFSTKLHHLTVNAANGVVTDTAGSTVVLNTSWQRLEVTFTPSAGAIYGRASVENVTPTTGVETLWYGWQVGPDVGANALLQSGIGRFFPFPPESPWTNVRIREGVTGLANGQTIYVPEYEIYGGRPVVYRVRGTNVVTGNKVVGPWSYYTMYVAPPATTLIRDPFQPENVLLAKRDGRSAEVNVTDDAGFHATGRDGDPITLSDWSGGQDGAMVLSWESAQEEKTIRDLVKSTRPILVQWHDGGASYIQFGSRNWQHFDASGGQFNGEYIEKDRP